MSFTYGFYNAINNDRAYDAKQFSSLFDGIINDGVFQSIGDWFATTPGVGMKVVVGTGRAWFDSTWNDNDDSIVFDLYPQDVTLPRYDTVVLEINETTRTNTIKIINGVAAVNPFKPTLTNNVFVHQHPLAHILVRPSSQTSSITASDIQILVGTTDCPFVTAILETADLSAMYAGWENDFNAAFESWEDAFNTWFANIQAQMSGNVATNLQNQIDQLASSTDTKIAQLTNDTNAHFSQIESDITIPTGNDWRVTVYTHLVQKYEYGPLDTDDVVSIIPFMMHNSLSNEYLFFDGVDGVYGREGNTIWFYYAVLRYFSTWFQYNGTVYAIDKDTFYTISIVDDGAVNSSEHKYTLYVQERSWASPGSVNRQVAIKSTIQFTGGGTLHNFGMDTLEMKATKDYILLLYKSGTNWAAKNTRNVIAINKSTFTAVGTYTDAQGYLQTPNILNTITLPFAEYPLSSASNQGHIVVQYDANRLYVANKDDNTYLLKSYDIAKVIQYMGNATQIESMASITIPYFTDAKYYILIRNDLFCIGRNGSSSAPMTRFVYINKNGVATYVTDINAGTKIPGVTYDSSTNSATINYTLANHYNPHTDTYDDAGMPYNPRVDPTLSFPLSVKVGYENNIPFFHCGSYMGFKLKGEDRVKVANDYPVWAVAYLIPDR